MENTLENIKITGLFGKKNIDWDLNPEVNVLVGKNGVGKSVVLQLINTAVNGGLKGRKDFLDYCNEVSIETSNESLMTAYANNFLGTKAVFSTVLALFEKDSKKKEEKKDILLDDIWKWIDSKDNSSANHIDVKGLDKNGKEIPKYIFSPKTPSIETEFISTVTASGNAERIIHKSDGSQVNLLDEEIEDELERFFSLDNASLRSKLVKSLNTFFEETDKVLSFDNQEIMVKVGFSEIPLGQLSAGERQLIYIFLKVANATRKNSIILMDEPEISLHLSWQEKLINEMRKINDTSQIIIVTHSPAIVMQGWLDCLVDFNDITKDINEKPARLLHES